MEPREEDLLSDNTRGPWRSRRGVMCSVSAGAIAALAATTLGAAPVSASPDPSVRHRSDRSVPDGLTSAGSLGLGTQRVAAGDTVDAGLRKATGPVDVMIELDTAPATTAFGQARGRGLAAARSAARTQTSAVRTAQKGIESRFGAAATKARTLYKVHAAYAGIAVRTDATRLSALAAIPGVKAIHRLTPKAPTNSSSVPLIGAPKVWKAMSQTGKGVRVGIIDTGIDYTHADFGGPGTVDAFQASTRRLGRVFPTAKVVGGYDFAGDAYDGASDDPAIDTPRPTRTRSTATATARTSRARRPASASRRRHDVERRLRQPTPPFDALDIGPGVAPEASLYALKVFGCDGSTNVAGQALDWAARPQRRRRPLRPPRRRQHVARQLLRLARGPRRRRLRQPRRPRHRRRRLDRQLR